MRRFVLSALLAAPAMPVVGAAQDRAPTVVLVVRGSSDARPDGGNAAVRRVEAELGSVGFEVLIVGLPEGADVSHEVLERLARASNAAAAVHVEHGADVWVSDRDTGRTLARSVVGVGQGDPDVLAMRTVELLRASLLELEMPAREPEPSAEQEPPTDPVAEPPQVATPTEPRRFLVSLGPAVTLSPGGYSPIGHAVVGGGYILSPWLELEAFVVLPVLAATREAPDGHIDLRPWLLGAGAGWLPSPWLRLGAGLTGGLVQTDGDGPQGRTSVNGTLLAHVRVGVIVRLSERLRIRGDTLLGVAIIRVVPRDLREARVGHWGRPAGLVSAALEMEL